MKSSDTNRVGQFRLQFFRFEAKFDHCCFCFARFGKLFDFFASFRFISIHIFRFASKRKETEIILFLFASFCIKYFVSFHFQFFVLLTKTFTMDTT
jgi:hypothetical protein